VVALLAVGVTTCSLATAPTGGYDRVLYRFDGRQLVVTRRWHTRLFRRP